MKKTIISIVRGKLRKVVYKYLFLRWLIIYGAHLHPTVRLSRTTTIDKVNPKGVFIDEYTYLAGGGDCFYTRYVQGNVWRNSYW